MKHIGSILIVLFIGLFAAMAFNSDSYNPKVEDDLKVGVVTYKVSGEGEHVYYLDNTGPTYDSLIVRIIVDCDDKDIRFIR